MTAGGRKRKTQEDKKDAVWGECTTAEERSEGRQEEDSKKENYIERVEG